MPHVSAKPGLVRGTGLSGMSRQTAKQPKARLFPRPDETDETWRDNAACRNQNPDLFFGVDGEKNIIRKAREEAATDFCKSHCPVMFACRAWAMQSGQDAGVWGGMSEDERRAQKRREARQKAKGVMQA